MSNWGKWYIERLKIEQRSPRKIQTVINFYSDVRWRAIKYWDVGNWSRNPQENSNDHNFWLEYWDTRNWTWKLEHIQTAITFDMDVWLRTNIYRDTWNSTWKLWANSNCDKSWLGRLIADRNISRLSKLNKESPRKFKLPCQKL